MPNFVKDLSEAKRLDDAAKSFGRLDQWTIKDGETAYLRLISEETITIGTHRFVETKDKPADCNWTKWPKAMWAICARDKAFRVVVGGEATDEFEEGYGTCYIHDKWSGVRGGKFNKDLGTPDDITYGLAVIRQVVTDPRTNRATGFSDETFEHKMSDGAVVVLPKIVVIAQKYSQFWGAVQAGAFLPPHSICDKDWIVSRKENDLTVTAGTPTPDLKPGSGAWARYDKAMQILEVSLDKYITDHSSPDHYARFFIPGATPTGGYGRGGGDSEEDADSKGAPAASPAAAELEPGKMAAFRQSLSSRAPAAEVAQQAQAAAADGLVAPTAASAAAEAQIAEMYQQ
jgi:hypothetical protein